MSFLSRILARVGRERIEETERRRSTASVDHRESDGDPGTSREDPFVGRVSGQDEGYLETGAERRPPDGDGESTHRPH